MLLLVLVIGTRDDLTLSEVRVHFIFYEFTHGGVAEAFFGPLRILPATPYTRKVFKTMVPAAHLGQSQRHQELRRSSFKIH